MNPVEEIEGLWEEFKKNHDVNDTDFCLWACDIGGYDITGVVRLMIAGELRNYINIAELKLTTNVSLMKAEDGKFKLYFYKYDIKTSDYVPIHTFELLPIKVEL